MYTPNDPIVESSHHLTFAPYNFMYPELQQHSELANILGEFTDDDGRRWIKEFVGNSWSKEIYLRQHKEIIFRVFVNNTFLQKGRKVTLIKKINNEVIDQKDFELSSDKLFEGWFRLG